jgi:DNA-binding transcriptional ArsR family regulator
MTQTATVASLKQGDKLGVAKTVQALDLLANRLRLRVLVLLGEGEFGVHELTASLNQKHSTASSAVARLRREGAIMPVEGRSGVYEITPLGEALLASARLVHAAIGKN